MSLINKKSKILNWSLGIGHWSLDKGFTLVELIVSVAITGILMLGISVFFSSSFQGLFRAQTQTTNTEKQYAINEIIRDKFTTLDEVLNKFSNDPPTADKILFKNNNTKDQLPFSYIGLTERDNNGDSINEKYLALKDMMIFNKVYHGDGNDFFADSGEGKIKRADMDSEVVPKLNPSDEFINFSSFEIIESGGKKIYYLVFPDKNSVMECACELDFCSYSSCSELKNLPQLLAPTDIVKDNAEEFLYITDSGNGRVIKYKLADQTYSILATPLKYPTGLAYYEITIGAVTKKWLFVAETLNNKILKINVENGATYTVVGDGDDKECEHTAKFCQLNMPTGIFADDVKQELYIADSGNNRILKVKDPGSPESLTFDFTLDENYILDYIEFFNSSWNGNGTYDEADSNLIGKQSNFSKVESGKEVFKNSDRLTTYEGINNCTSSSNSFYANEESAVILNSNDKIIINNNKFTVTDPPDEEGTECREPPENLGDPENPSLKKWLISVTEDASGVTDGQTVFFSNPNNPTDVVVNITDIPDDDFVQGGFQTFTIKTYDLMKGLVETDYYPIRIGDGELGTDEDTVEVLVERKEGSYRRASFPTGVTNTYFANSGDTIDSADSAKVMRLDLTGTPPDLNQINIDSFETFDYVSDFVLKDDEPLQFIEYNDGKLLELVIKALVDEEKPQTYTLNANIPQ